MACWPGTFRYRVRPGDTYGGLAQRFNTTVGAIGLANPGVNPRNLRIGQPLCIPGYPRPPRPWQRACGPGLRRYVIQPGDTIGEIAYRRGVDPWVILRLNPVDPRNLQPGQVLCIP